MVLTVIFYAVELVCENEQSLLAELQFSALAPAVVLYS